MTRPTFANVTKALQAEGLTVELVRGEGYQYFAWVGEGFAETVSVYVCYLSHLSFERWMEEGRQAAATMREEQLEAAAFPSKIGA